MRFDNAHPVFTSWSVVLRVCLVPTCMAALFNLVVSLQLGSFPVRQLNLKSLSTRCQPACSFRYCRLCADNDLLFRSSKVYILYPLFAVFCHISYSSSLASKVECGSDLVTRVSSSYRRIVVLNIFEPHSRPATPTPNSQLVMSALVIIANHSKCSSRRFYSTSLHALWTLMCVHLAHRYPLVLYTSYLGLPPITFSGSPANGHCFSFVFLCSLVPSSSYFAYFLEVIFAIMPSQPVVLSHPAPVLLFRT